MEVRDQIFTKLLTLDADSIRKENCLNVRTQAAKRAFLRSVGVEIEHRRRSKLIIEPRLSLTYPCERGVTTSFAPSAEFSDTKVLNVVTQSSGARQRIEVVNTLFIIQFLQLRLVPEIALHVSQLEYCIRDIKSPTNNINNRMLQSEIRWAIIIVHLNACRQKTPVHLSPLNFSF